MIHTCTTIVDNPELFSFSDNQAVLLQILNRLSRWSVPVFFMITGALLLNPEKEISYRKCLQKYCLRILACIFLFGWVMALMKFFMEAGFGLNLLLKAFCAVFTGDSFDHLWYLYALIGIYLVLPVLKAFVNADSSGSNTLYLLVIMFVLSFTVSLLEGLLDISIEFYVPFTYTIFYVLLGYYLVSHAPGSLRLDFLLIALTACILFAVQLADLKAGTWSSYSSPVVAIMAMAVFDAFRHIRPCPERKRALLWHADRLCFGVYLIHPIFIHFTYRLLHITPTGFGSLYPVMTILLWILFCLCSFAGSEIMSRIPGIRKLVA